MNGIFAFIIGVFLIPIFGLLLLAVSELFDEIERR
jgi:hypothetical protein